MIAFLFALTLMEQALRFKDERKYEQAVAILVKFPDDPDAVNNLGGVRYLMGDFEAADLDFQRAIRLEQSDPRPWNNRCLLRVVQGDPATALVFCEAALGKQESFYPAWVNKGFALFELGKHEEAALAFAKASELSPEAAEPYLGLALCARRSGKGAEAPKYWKRAAELKASLTRGPKDYEKEEGPFFGPESLAAYRELLRLFPVKRRAT